MKKPLTELHGGQLVLAFFWASWPHVFPVFQASEMSFSWESSYGEGEPKTVINIFNAWLFLMNSGFSAEGLFAIEKMAARWCDVEMLDASMPVHYEKISGIVNIGKMAGQAA